MKKIKIFQVDAFAHTLFSGNPAAVCPLESWLDDDIMQSIAQENNLSETAFFIIKNNKYYIRWFTPKVEMDLAGHPTLAAAYIIFKELSPKKKYVEFVTPSGDILSVSLKKNILSMEMPSYFPKPRNFKNISNALRSDPVKFLYGIYGMAVFRSQKEIIKLSPNFDALKKISYDGIIATAPGNDCDFVSRFFAPKLGIEEDPVTGSAHCQLIPYWSKILAKKNMFAKQLSPRGGELYCTNLEDRVIIGGKCIIYMKGDLILK